MMVPTLQSLGIDQLSREEQLDLVGQIWDRLAAGKTPPFLSPSQRRELVRRIAEDDANPDDLIPWEEVKADARRRQGR